MNTDQLVAGWLQTYAQSEGSKVVLSIRRAEPRFQTHNYFARFKIQTAVLDGTGENPREIECAVLEVSETDQAARLVSTPCDSIRDL